MLAQSSVRVLRERPAGELGPKEAKEFRDTGKYGGEEQTEKGAEGAERSSQIHVLVVSAKNGGKTSRSASDSRLFQGSFRNTRPAEGHVARSPEADIRNPNEYAMGSEQLGTLISDALHLGEAPF